MAWYSANEEHKQPLLELDTYEKPNYLTDDSDSDLDVIVDH